VRFVGYDIETWGSEDGYALQPWRVKEGTAGITLSAAYCQGKRNVETEYHSALMEDLRKLGKPVVTWNGVFDLAWLYAAGIDIRGIKWMDAMLLWKWLANSQSGPMSWALKDGAKRFLKDWPKLQEFIAIKGEEFMPDPMDPYWLTRVTMDAEATALIAEAIWPQLTPQQQHLAKIQSISLPTMAASWVNGVQVDLQAIKDARPGIISEMLNLEKALGLQEISPTGKYIPSKVLRSPTKMRKLLYNDWGLTCTRFTDKQAQSTDKAALTYLADIDDRVITVLKWRELNTILSKFIEGPLACCEYLNSNVTHATPKIFSTYTGRMTYSSRSKKNRTGIPLHQTPRKKEIRSYVVAPDGYYIFEADAMGQEMRGMATMSKDPAMIELFNSKHPYDDGHSLMGAQIGGIPFEEFIERKQAKDPLIVGPDGLRPAGKFCNLSMAYRSGPATSRRVARVQYGLDITIDDAVRWKSVYTRLFRGVETYWKDAPKNARARGFAETPAGRRYALTRWHDLQWGTSSSAINFPIQGMGADQRDLAIAETVITYPELWDKFYIDLHDGMYWLIPITAKVSYLQDIMNALDTIDYEKYWKVKLPVPYIWEGSFGPDWGHKIEFADCEDKNITLEDYYRANK